jgi:hypothetical protein
MAEAVTAVRTEVPVLVAFGQLVMFYWQLRLLNRWTNGTRRSCSGRRSERTRGVVSRMGGEAAAGGFGDCQAHSGHAPALQTDGAYEMKQTALLLLGLVLLPRMAQADQTPASVCVEALEQLGTLQTFAPVYKLTGGQERHYLADADRPAEVARLKKLVAGSCSSDPKIRRGEESEAERLHLARSPECMEERDKLSMMVKPESRSPADDIAEQRKQVAARCPAVGLSNVWLIHSVPVPPPWR